jgi:hypothetical protein
MNGQTKFDENELKLIQKSKQTMKVLAKVTKDLDPKEVIKDEDIAKLIDEKEWEKDDPKTLAKALADEEIGPMIRERLTPDLPHLSPEQEAMVIGQLGATIFGELLKD